MPNISIVMPLFNAEKYLAEALQSVLNQTYEDFELICIDDCSTDDTRRIVEKYREGDSRITILINEERLGAALSRNKGLQEAEGKYILFLDGDDIFEEELLEKACGAMERYQADVVLFEYLHVLSESIYTKKIIERPENFCKDYCKSTFSMRDYKPRDFLWWKASTCNRMLRRNFLEKNRLEFQNLQSQNDIYFAQMALFCAKRIICLDDRRVMVYARDHSEPQRISNRRNPMSAYYAMEKVCRELSKRGMLAEYAPYLYYRLPVHFIYALLIEENEQSKKDFYDFLKKEGICKCLEYGKEYWEQIDEYDKYLLESFQNNAYESRWFENPDTYFQFYLKKMETKSVNLYESEVQKMKKLSCGVSESMERFF